MTNKQESKLKMSLSTDEFLVINEGLTKDLPEFGTTITEFRNTLGSIKIIDGQQKNVRTGIAKNKRDNRNTLITLAAENSGKVFAFAKVSNNKPLMDEVNFSISDVGRMTDVALRTYADELNKKMVTLLESLGKYGITADTQKKYAEAFAAYENTLVKPRVSIAEKREATKELQTLFISLDSQISKLDAIIGIIRYKEVKFYNGYRTVRKLVNSNSGEVALKATAKDITSSVPLKGVLFTLTSDETVLTKKTASKGSFHIKNMKPGTYKVVVKKDRYKGKEVTVEISDGVRNELTVELEKA
jgi:hypothetical protein